MKAYGLKPVKKVPGRGLVANLRVSKKYARRLGKQAILFALAEHEKFLLSLFDPQDIVDW
jgi:hypothetical protein